MASGSFTQGSTIELSCDGPMRAPYTCYLQGGLNFAASRAGGAAGGAERLFCLKRIGKPLHAVRFCQKVPPASKRPAASVSLLRHAFCVPGEK